MDNLDKLILINNTEALNTFLSENIQEVFDELFLSDYDEIKLYSNIINSYYSLNFRIIKNLDFIRIYNSSFILLLANFFERFDYPTSFNSIISLCKRKEINISSRLQAGHLLLKKKTNNQEYIDIYDDILCLLNKAYISEEDDVHMVTYTFLNYFHKVINDTYQYDCAIAVKLQENVKKSKSEKCYYFLEDSIIDYLININLNSYSEKESENLQKRISSCIRRKKKNSTNTTTSQFLVEKDTEYSENLKNIECTFQSIRFLSVQQSLKIEKKELIRNSLGRGGSVLTNEEQLYMYFKSFGNMHKAKLDSAFQTTTNKFKDNSIEIIDWGCGQALASMVFFEFLTNNQISTNISQIILIEPSELCLKRGALHVVKYNIVNNIKTINKYIDDLIPLDIKTNNTNIKIHLFSNILDVEKFSIAKLASLITATQKGRNYFICISPSITNERTDRVDAFKRHFKNKYKSFEGIFEINNGGRINDPYWNCNNNYNGNIGVYCNHTENGCDKKWTRIIQVFKVEI